MSYNTYITYEGNGSTRDFAIPFSYLKQEDVVVTRQNGPVSYVFLNPNTIRVSTPIDVGDSLLIERRTNILNASVVYQNGSSFTGDNINRSLDQIRYAVQEAIDRVGTVYARVYEISSIDSLFNGVTKTFRLDSGGANLGTKVYDTGLWQVTLNGILLETGIDYSLGITNGIASITFVDAPQATDNSQLRFIKFYDGAYGGGEGGSGTGAQVLDDLNDVSINNPVSGNILSYNGTQWTNVAPGSGGTGGGTSGGGGIDIVTSTPNSCSVDGKPIYNATDGKLYICKNGVYVDIFAAYTPDAPAPITIVDTLPSSCTAGQIVLLRTDNKLYTCSNGTFVPLIANVTPADVLSGLFSSGARPVEIVNALPTTGNTEGRLVYLTTDQQLYIYKNGAWVLLKNDLTPNAPSGIEVVSSNPTTGNFEGRTVFNTTDNKLYKFTSSGWVQVVEPTGAAATVADGSLTTAKFASSIRPVEIVSSLPTTGNVAGRLVFLTTDSKLYRFDGTAFVTSVAAGDITGQIGSSQLAANSVVAGKIAAGAISATEIAAGAINASKIAAGAITSEKITALAVTAEKVAADAITSDKIAANAITAGKIQAGVIGATEIAANAITADKIATGAITAGKIQAGAIGASEIAALAVTSVKIAADAITSDKIAANAITAGKIQAGAIGASQIASQAITADKLAANQVLIGNAQIADASITSLKVAGNAITAAGSAFVSTQREINSTAWFNAASFTITLTGLQPVLLWASCGIPAARIGSSTNFDVFFDGNYWKGNTGLSECEAQFTLVGPSTYSSGVIGSYSTQQSSTAAISFATVMSGIAAGTYTVHAQLRKAPDYASRENFAVRTISLSVLETRR